MKRRRFHLIGNTFTHLTGGNKGYAVHGKESKYIEWVNDPSVGHTFYVEDKIRLAKYDGIRGKKYGLLLESREMVSPLIEDVKKNYAHYFEFLDIIFTHIDELVALDPRFQWCPSNGFWIQEARLYPKSKNISMIASHKGYTECQQLRLRWAQRLRDRGEADVYGRGWKEIALKEEGLCDYRFSIVVENGFYDSYFSEKIMDCFATGTIPIYQGCPSIGRFFNSEGILPLTDNLDLSSLTPELYRSKLVAIRDNLERVMRYEVPEDYLFLHYFA